MKVIEIIKTMELINKSYNRNTHKKKKTTYPKNVTFNGIFKDKLRKLEENNSKK